MPAELPRFETQGPTWSERATVGELGAVINPGGGEAGNRFAHGVGLFAADTALWHARRRGLKPGGRVIDFGCGTGRFVRYFGGKGYSVLGVDLTPEMLTEARRHGLPPGCDLQPTDGVHVPAPDASADLVWVCGVLKYGLYVNPAEEFVRQPDPAYPAMAREFARVLKPGGLVVNVEMYVNVPPDEFVPDFERAGFRTADVRVIHRWTGRPERRLQSRWVPSRLAAAAGRWCAASRYRFDDPRRPGLGMRDYLFVWHKGAL
ncbi:MAG: hypothetical protein C0501_03295 [Isosphaera sp.]|nr:hypothetical protein [Isosphaera sp.]